MNTELVIPLLTVGVGLYVIARRKELVRQQREWMSHDKNLIKDMLSKEEDEAHSKNILVAGSAMIVFGLLVILYNVYAQVVTIKIDLLFAAFSFLSLLLGVYILVFGRPRTIWKVLVGASFLLLTAILLVKLF